MKNYTVRNICRIEGMRRRAKERMDRVRNGLRAQKAWQDQFAAQMNAAANAYMSAHQNSQNQNSIFQVLGLWR